MLALECTVLEEHPAYEQNRDITIEMFGTTSRASSMSRA